MTAYAPLPNRDIRNFIPSFINRDHPQRDGFFCGAERLQLLFGAPFKSKPALWVSQPRFNQSWQTHGKL
jgi:hypothetical protein